MKQKQIGGQIKKGLMVLSVVALVAMSAWCADTWYVKPDGTDSADRGKSAETPFRTLQYAHDQASAGDTIKLLPGIYAEGVADDPNHKNRLVVSKRLFFRAVGKKSETIIKGQLDPSTGKWGANAMRCVYVAEAGYDSEFHGITFKEGGGGKGVGADSEGSYDWGGCVHVKGIQSAADKNENVLRAFFVDCDFIDGKAQWGGGLNGGTAIRCYFNGCDGASFGSSASRSALWNCVIVNGQSSASAARPQVGNYALVVNCVVYGSNGSGFDRFCKVYNSYCANMSEQEFSQAASYPVTYDHSICGSGAENRGSGTQPNQYILLSPATGDYRPIAGSALIGAGLTAHLTDVIKLPEDMVWTDFNGNLINTNLVACDVGAVQGGVTPLTGKIIFPAAVTVAGHYNLRAVYSFAETFPSFIHYETGNAKYFRSRLSGFTGGSTFRYPERDGKIWFCYPPAVGDTMTVTESNDVLGGELWTDPKADAATADGTAAHPFRTIQAAMDHISARALSNVIVHALPGEYAEGGAVHGDATSRVVVADAAIILRSTGGAAVTTIRGAAAPLAKQPYPDCYPGCGDGAVRCVSFDGWTERMIEGFTLVDGRTRVADYTQDKASDRGGAIEHNADGGVIQVIDCVITNCASVRSTMFGGWYKRCRFYDCQGFGGVFRNSNITASYIDSSCKIGKGAPGASPNEVIGTGSRAYHVTCPNGGHAAVSLSPQLFVNSLFGTMAPYSTSTGYRYWGSVLASAHWVDNLSCDHADMGFADPASGDCRLIGNTPATLAGKMPERGTDDWELWAKNYAARITLDIDGNPIRINPNGCPMAGCWQTVADGIWIDTPAKGGIAASSGHLGANLVPASGTLTVSFTKDALRPLSAYVVNGITNPVPPSCALTLSAADVAGGLYLSDCVYTPHWYVDAVNGDDANLGFIPGAAKKTLKAVLGDSRVASGDTVHAAEGTYATDPMAYEITSKNTSMKADSPAKKFNMYVRAIVPAGVTLQADGRVENTVIVGAKDADADTSRYNLGSNSVHGVFLAGAGSTIRGFTVTGGYSDWYDTSIYGDDWVLPIGGAGITGHGNGRDNAYAYDCIISNNWGYTSAAIRFLNAIRCVVTENHAVGSAGAGREINAVGSLFDRNYQDSSAAVFEFTKLDGCTFGPHDRNLADTESFVALSQGSSGSAYITNCLVLGSCGKMGAMTRMVGNSVFANGRGTFQCLDDCYIGNGTDVLVDADLRPIPGKNPAVDRGDRANAHPLLPLDYDASGSQRIMNGEIDVGALEADWRPVYARDIARSGKFSVAAAGEDVVETEGKTVAIPDGGTLTAVWRNTSGMPCPYALSVRLAGEGTLTVLLNGEPVREISSTGTTDLRFDGPLAENRLDFAYAGTGAAEILSSGCKLGSLIFLR